MSLRQEIVLYFWYLWYKTTDAIEDTLENIFDRNGSKDKWVV